MGNIVLNLLFNVEENKIYIEEITIQERVAFLPLVVGSMQ